MGAAGLRYAPIVGGLDGQSILIWYHFDEPQAARDCAQEYVNIGLGRHASYMPVFVPQFIHGHGAC